MRKPVRAGGPAASPFARLAVAHTLATAGDTLVTMALAGSLFFSISPQAARGRVALYLLLTMAPFAVVAPFLGPVLDRSRGGRRSTLIVAAAARAVACLLMAGQLQSLWLFPLTFVVLVLSKAQMITKSALVPTTVGGSRELVTANSRLALLSAITGFATALPGIVVLKVGFLGPDWVVRLAAVAFAAAAVAALRISRPAEAKAAGADRRRDRESEAELHAPAVRMAATGMAVLRATVGFLTFMVAFAFRARDAPAWWFGLVLLASLAGTLVGNAVAPVLRRVLVEERILLGSLALVSVVGAVGGRLGPLSGLCLLAAGVGLAAAAAKLAFDSIVQRDAPDAVRGRTFARFETRFQLVWVAGAFLPVVAHVSERLGSDIVALASALTLVSYVGALAAARQRARNNSPLEGPDRPKS